MAAEPTPSTTRWLRFGGATVALVLAACGGAGSSAPSPSATPGAAPTTIAVAPGPEATQPAPTLEEAIAGMSGGYRFDTTVTVGEEVTTTMTGRVIEDASAFTVAAGGAEIDYVITAAGQWVRENDEWVLLAEAAPLVSPLEPLLEPIASEVVERQGRRTVLELTYPAAALQLPGGGEVTVVAELSETRLVALQFTATVEGEALVTRTEFMPLGDADPITAPTAG